MGVKNQIIQTNKKPSGVGPDEIPQYQYCDIQSESTLLCYHLVNTHQPKILYSTPKETHQSFLGGIMENRSKK